MKGNATDCHMLIRMIREIKLLQNDPDTGRIFAQPLLISFKHDKNIGNFLVTSLFQTSEQPGTFKCGRHDAKHALSFATLRKYQDPSDQSRSLIISPAPQPMSSTT